MPAMALLRFAIVLISAGSAVVPIEITRQGYQTKYPTTLGFSSGIAEAKRQDQAAVRTSHAALVLASIHALTLWW